MAYSFRLTPTMIESSVSGATWSEGLATKKLVQEIFDATVKQRDNISFIYRETLRAVKNIFSELQYYKEDESLVAIQCIHGNPERTIAKLKQDNNIILPIISVVQTSSEEDPDRRRPRQVVLHQKVWDESRQRAFRVVGLAPKAVNLLYDVNVWTKYKSDLDQISEQMHLKFHPSINVVTSYNDQTKGYLVQETDQSSVDLGDKEDRILRRSYSLRLQTYIPAPQFLMTSTGKLESFNNEVELADLISKL